jgi:hypothetical protein
MGRIRTTHRHQRTIVVVEGRLTASDMGRLEYACCRELISNAPRLEIDLSRVVCIDATAAAVLRRMADRGATVKMAAGVLSFDTVNPRHSDGLCNSAVPSNVNPGLAGPNQGDR